MFRNDFADFIRRKFPKMFRFGAKSHSKLFIQDNYPVLNYFKARRVLNSAGANYLQYQFAVAIL